MTALHELVIEAGELHFHCNAEPLDQKSPECWFACEYDDEGNLISREDLGECNAGIWMGEQGIESEGSVRIPVDIRWSSDGPALRPLTQAEVADEFEKCDPVWLEAVPDRPVPYCFIAEGRIVHNRVDYHLSTENQFVFASEMPFRILACGGRDFTNVGTIGTVINILAEMHPGATLVHGGAPGADSWCGYYGGLAGLTVEAHAAKWNIYGKKAGPIRNQQMLDSGIDLVVAFPGGRGTSDMVRRARKAHVRVWEIDPELITAGIIEEAIQP